MSTMPAAPAAAPAPAPAAPVLTPAHGYALGIISEGSVAPPDRVLAELINCGAPTTGQYAQNGLWDDSDDESDRGAPSASGSTSTDGQQRPTSDTSNTGSSRSWRQRLSSTSVRAPKTSRRGILSMTTTPVGEAPWPWGRKSVQSVGVNAAATAAAAAAALPARTSLQLGAGSAPVVPPAPVIPSTATFAQLEAVSPVSAPDTASTVSTPEVPAPASAPAPATASIPAPRPMQERVMSPFPPLTTVLLAPPAEPSRGTLRPSKSRTRLRSMGMGNRRTAPPPPAELAKKVDKKIEVFESPVATHSSSAPRPPLNPVVANNSNSKTMRAGQTFVLAAKPSTPVNPKVDKDPRSATAAAVAAAEDAKPKSAWKRGVERLWRSKSASGLRESFQRRVTENDAPPVPVVPQQHRRTSIVPGAGAAATVSTTSLLGLSNVAPSPSIRESVVTPLPYDDLVYSELDKRYPPYSMRGPSGTSPLIADQDTFESDPFASAFDYSSVPRPSSRASHMSRSQMPDFTAQFPSVPESHRTLGGIIPRLRKSKSMVMGSRPTSIVGLFTERRNRVASPLGYRDNLQPGMNELIMAARAGAATSSGSRAMSPMVDLKPRRPMFYNMFDIASEDESTGSGGDDTPPRLSVSVSASASGSGSAAPSRLELDLHGDVPLPAVPIEDSPLPVPPSALSQSHSSLRRCQSAAATTTTAPPDLVPETSISGHSVDAAEVEVVSTPVPLSAPPHVTSFPASVIVVSNPKPTPVDNGPSMTTRQTPLSPPSTTTSLLLASSPTPRPASLSFDKTSTIANSLSDSPSFQDLYAQLGIWPEQVDRWLAQQQLSHSVSAATLRSAELEFLASNTLRGIPDDDEGDGIDGPARDDQSACDPSPLSSPRTSSDADAPLTFCSFPSDDEDDDEYTLAPLDLFYSPGPGVDHGAPLLLDDILAIEMAFQPPNGSSFRSHGNGSAMSPSGSRQTSNGSTNQQSQERSTGTSGAGDSWWNTMPRRSGGSSSSRDSSRERPRRRSAAPADGGWIDSSSDEAEASSENENDDVPLSKLHPAASAAQQQRLVDAVRRREARRAERERKLRTSKSQLLERERDRMIKQRDQRDIQREGTTRRSRNQAEWSGEGGVPADVLAGRLERVAVSASATGGSSSQRVGPAPALTRTHTSASQHGRPARSTGDSAATPATPGTAGASLSASLSRTPTAGASAHSSLSTQSGGGRLSSSTSRVPASTGWPALGRSATTSSRHRTSSNVRDEATREAAPPVPRRGLPVRCTILTAAGTRPLSVEYTPDTTAREVLQRAREAASLVDGASGSSLGWAVWERFGELGLERQVREYEAIAAVVRGWDAQRTDNGLFVREGHTANLTHERAVPSSAPFVGGWVQLETKLGKWSKRWMETRGGQIFLSKNEKGKEEIQVNTIFSDIYVPSGTYAAPQRYVFALKRLEPLASFESPREHIHYISTDDATGYKLATAAYSSRSYTLVQANMHTQISNAPQHALNRAVSLNRAKSMSTSTSNSNISNSNQHASASAKVSASSAHDTHLAPGNAPARRPSRSKVSAAPLVDLGNQPAAGSALLQRNAGFTGKGLLGKI